MLAVMRRLSGLSGDDRPLAVLQHDLGDRMAHRRHAEIDLLLGHGLAGIVLGGRREHHVGRDVLVVDAEQAVVGIGRTLRQRHEGDVVAIVAEPLLLLVGRDLVAVEFGQAGSQRIAPARHDRRLVAFGDGVRLVVDALQLGEAERRLRRRGMRLAGEQRSDEAAAGKQCAGADAALEQAAPRDAAAMISRITEMTSRGIGPCVCLSGWMWTCAIS